MKGREQVGLRPPQWGVWVRRVFLPSQVVQLRAFPIWRDLGERAIEMKDLSRDVVQDQLRHCVICDDVQRKKQEQNSRVVSPILPC